MSHEVLGVVMLVALLYACLCLVDGLLSYRRTLKLRIMVQKDRERYKALFPHDEETHDP